jgi:hypothetical protein
VTCFYGKQNPISYEDGVLWFTALYYPAQGCDAWLPLLDEFRTQNWRQIKGEIVLFYSCIAEIKTTITQI